MKNTKELKLMANTIRQDIIRMLVEAKSGHPGGSLGMADIFTVLYFHVLRHDPKSPTWIDRDRFVLSNGHICPVLYATLANAGYFPKQELLSLRKLGSKLQGHPHKGTLPGVENSSGPLGQGISQAVGMAIVGKREKKSWRVYSVVGDGELDEGQTWEAIMLAAKYKLDNLITVVDRNNIQIDGTTDDVLPLEPLADKFRAFGWCVIEMAGNDVNSIIKAIGEAQTVSGQPIVLIARTMPGKGVSFMEGKFDWHGKAPNREQGELAIKELETERKLLEVG
ncbi:1-deoxy-D-xylulose-5-phosphate synthase [Candidatus Bilamarchaeum dharawalense]|uniref:1-deoxy-D-xylulose-5-phosphate synthase n=1 Tax=Candidatus Bilamarchaeum dharawalense TaxID=2885759 RepID=A0A5E4LWN8_9ARCH|nr:1-deoxy-D-xylulose-5-phosphate synthase [Candidatus Bilamarchaeum dharawalense]